MYKKINLSQLKKIVKEVIKEQESEEREIDRIMNKILSTGDGPVNRIVAIYRAIELAKADKTGNIENYAQALYESLEFLERFGDLSSSEYNNLSLG
jgi:uncharacterized protein YaaN involved in tellurite resistance